MSSIPLRYWVLMIFIASALYAHYRGKVRFRLARALTDFTVLIAPVNALMYLFSRAPATPYLDTRVQGAGAAAAQLGSDPRGGAQAQ